MLTLSFRSLTCLIAIIAISVTVQADIIARWDFVDDNGAALSFDPNVTASNFTSGPGFSLGFPDAQGISSGSDNLGNTGYDTGEGFLFTSIGNGVNTNGTQPKHLQDGEYFEVSITPDAGNTISYDTLSFFAFVNDKNRGADQFVVTSSIDGHNATQILGSGEISPSGVNATNALAYDIDLTGSQFQDVSTATDFRIYLYDAGNNENISLTGLDNLVFEGVVTVAVPEPNLHGRTLLWSLSALHCDVANNLASKT